MLPVHYLTMAFILSILAHLLLDAEESNRVPLINMIPAIEKLGAEWAQSELIYYLDPNHQPEWYVPKDQPDPEAFKTFLERTASRLGCDALLKVAFGKGELAINSGGHFVFLYRWGNQEALSVEWSELLEKAPLNQDEVPPVGSASCWAHHDLFHSLAFRRGPYLVRVECGRSENFLGLLALAEAVDLNILKATKQQPGP